MDRKTSSVAKVPVLYVLIGIPGSGKTTWSKEAEREKHTIATNPSDFPGNTKADTWEHYRMFLEEVVAEGHDIVADACHLKRFHRRMSTRVAKKAGYKIVAVIFHTPFELCCKRREGRFDREQMGSMRNSMEAIIAKEGFNALIHVYPREERTLSLVKMIG